MVLKLYCNEILCPTYSPITWIHQDIMPYLFIYYMNPWRYATLLQQYIPQSIYNCTFTIPCTIIIATVCFYTTQIISNDVWNLRKNYKTHHNRQNNLWLLCFLVASLHTVLLPYLMPFPACLSLAIAQSALSTHFSVTSIHRNRKWKKIESLCNDIQKMQDRSSTELAQESVMKHMLGI